MTGIVIDPPGSTYGPRLPKNYEIIWIMEGEVKATFGQTVLLAKEGTFLFRPPGLRDYYEWSTKGRTVHAYVQFDLPGSKRTSFPKKGIPLFRRLPPNDVLRPLFAYLLKIEESKDPALAPLLAQTLDLMLLAYRSGEVTVKAKPSSRLPELMEKAIGLILDCTAKDPPVRLRLSELSRQLNTSPENLCRQFQKNVRLGPLEYAKMVRLDRAANALRGTPQSLKQIAASTGFYDAYHLSRSFKRVYGMSPKSFRETEDNEWLTQKNPLFRILYKGMDPRWAASTQGPASKTEKPGP